MFGLEHVTQATDWLKAKPNRAITIFFVSQFEVEFIDSQNGVGMTGNGPDLMTALKAGLALVDPKL